MKTWKRDLALIGFGAALGFALGFWTLRYVEPPVSSSNVQFTQIAQQLEALQAKSPPGSLEKLRAELEALAEAGAERNEVIDAEGAEALE